ncbi:MAG: gliding motility-associated ABC transporter substrate-binding protein GldG [Bacteroidales bacterium]|nr:gliding motility-associated ABC transporter substrate-binding protein GldG [Bacteroidales bacterium]
MKHSNIERKDNHSSAKRNIKLSNLLYLGAAILIVVFVNLIGRYVYTRFDLTSEKRYTLSESTKKLLRNIDETVLFRVYLEGEFPGDFKRLQNETKDMLNQFRSYNDYVEYEFFDPNGFDDKEQQQTFYRQLASKGIQPTVIENKGEGSVQRQIIIPAVEVTYKGRSTIVNLLPGQKWVSQDEELNNAVQTLEYNLTDAIRRLSKNMRTRVGFLQGHGELERESIFDIQMTLVDYYSLENVTIDGNVNALTERRIDAKDSTKYIFKNRFDLIIIPKPTQPFSDQDLYILDQFVMYGGRILWLIDPVAMDIDSLQSKDAAIAVRFPFENLDDMLFTYGVRVNPNLLLDIRCMPIPMQDGTVGGKPTINFHPWYYFPEFVPPDKQAHPIVKNLDLIKGEFVSSIDLIDNDIQKTVLLTTSSYVHVSNAPVRVDLNVARVEPDQRLFNRKDLPVAVLLEGRFRSAWRSRLSPYFTEIPEMGYRDISDTTKMIVIADGDIIRNRFNYQYNQPYPLGYDNYTRTMYANKNLILNAVNYLCGDEDVLQLRSREIKLRKLDPMSVKENRLRYQLINIIVPILILVLAGAVILLVRRFRNVKH